LNPEEDLIHYEIFKNDYIHPPPSIQFDSVTEIPNSFDWRTFSLVSKPMDQTRCGGCWAFAVVRLSFIPYEKNIIQSLLSI